MQPTIIPGMVLIEMLIKLKVRRATLFGPGTQRWIMAGTVILRNSWLLPKRDAKLSSITAKVAIFHNFIETPRC